MLDRNNQNSYGGVPATQGQQFHAPAPQMYTPQYGGYYGFNPNEPEPDENFDPLKLLWFIFHYRWLVTSFIALGAIAGVMITLMQTPQFRATSRMEINTSGAKVLDDVEILTQGNDLRAFETARQKLQSRDLARRIAFELNLAEKNDFLAPTPNFSVFNLFNRAFGRKFTDDLSHLTAEERDELAISKVNRALSAQLLRNTSIIEVTYRHPVSKYTSAIANQAVKSYVDQSVDQTSETSDLARDFIQEQVQEVKLKLQGSEKDLLDYVKESGITVTEGETSLITANLEAVNKEMTIAVQERQEAQRLMDQVNQGRTNSLPEVIDSKAIQATKLKIAEMRAEYQQKLGVFKPGFPEMRRLAAQINELQRQQQQEISIVANSVRQRHEQAVQKEADLKREFAKLEEDQAKFRDKNIQYTILKREVDSNRKQYESLVNKLNDVGVGSELKTKAASIIDEAKTPKFPYSPRLFINLIASILAFMGLSAALIYILELMNNTFAVPDQIESELKLPVLGIIPKLSERELDEAFTESSSSLSEAYRSLRTSLQFTGADGAVKSLLVTSSEPSEGKSTTSYKLAEDFAALGLNVLIIDADLRKPRLHRMFNTDNTIGLSNLLTNVVRQGEFKTLFRPTKNPRITFLSAGTIPPNPADLLSSQKMSLTVHYCTKKYDMVVVDAPPVMGLSDAPILSRLVEATLLVVATKQPTRKSAKNALNRLKSAGANVVGAALTKFEVDKFDYNYAYRYMRYDYYSYGNENQPKLTSNVPNTAEPGSAGATASAAAQEEQPAPASAFFTRMLRRSS